ncbi:hypothetical protein vseg_011292 [Gypsophila vaccaria]
MINILVILLTFLRLQSFVSSTNYNQTILFGYTIRAFENNGNKYKVHNLLNIFSSRSKNTRSYNSTLFGHSPNNHLYGLYMCRGDIDRELCRICIKNAKDAILIKQSYGKEAMIWYDHCMLRYSNKPFIGQLDNNTNMMSTWDHNNVTNSPARFTNTLRYTMVQLAAQAAGSRNKFATKVVKLMEGESLYTLVQCTPDLTANDCRKCLMNSIERVRKMGASKGGKVMQLNCIVQYEMFPFFYSNKIKAFQSPAMNSTEIKLRVQLLPLPLYNGSDNSTSSSSPSSGAADSPMFIKFKAHIGPSSFDNDTVTATLCFASTTVSNSTMIKQDGSKVGAESE